MNSKEAALLLSKKTIFLSDVSETLSPNLISLCPNPVTFFLSDDIWFLRCYSLHKLQSQSF